MSIIILKVIMDVRDARERVRRELGAEMVGFIHKIVLLLDRLLTGHGLFLIIMNGETVPSWHILVG